MQVDESGEIIHLETRCPWKRHLTVLTEKLSLPDLCVKFVIYRHEMWLVQASAIDRQGDCNLQSNNVHVVCLTRTQA